MNLEDNDMNIQVLPDLEILSQEKKPSDPNHEKDNLEILVAKDLRAPLKDDDLFENKKEEKEEYEKDSVYQSSEEEVKTEKQVETKPEPKVEQTIEQKPTKKVKKKRKPLSEAHRAALARGRAKALENRRRKAAIRKKLKEEKKAEKDKQVQYEYEKFQTDKKKKEIERKNILLNETIDLNSIDKFFDIMDKYERLKTLRKQQYYKEKLKLKQKKYTHRTPAQVQKPIKPKENTTIKKRSYNKKDPFSKYEEPVGPYAHLWK